MPAMTFTEKLNQLGTRYDELTQQLSTAELVADSSKFQKAAKQHAELEEIVAKHREYKQIEKDLAGAHQMFLETDDAEMKQMARRGETACRAQGKRRAGAETSAIAKGSQRRKERDRGNPRRHRRG
jgi:protein subunit release factor A